MSSKTRRAVDHAMCLYGEAALAVDDLPHYQGCGNEEPMKSALEAKRQALQALGRAVFRYAKAERKRAQILRALLKAEP